jgi:hypothetical protein
MSADVIKFVCSSAELVHKMWRLQIFNFFTVVLYTTLHMWDKQIVASNKEISNIFNT